MKRNLTPRRVRWAKERLGLVAPQLPKPDLGTVVWWVQPITEPDPLMEEAQAFLDAHPPQPEDPAPSPREAHMLSVLMDAAGGSYAQRQRTLDKVRSWGWTDEQISAALAAETRRLEYTGYLLRNPPEHRSLRQVIADRIRNEPYEAPGYRPANQVLAERRAERINAEVELRQAARELDARTAAARAAGWRGTPEGWQKS